MKNRLDADLNSFVKTSPTEYHRRVSLVDASGGEINGTNPLKVQLTDGSVNIGTVNAELEVQLSHASNNPDAGDIGDRVNTIDGFLDHRVEIINNVRYDGYAEAGSSEAAEKWRITRTIRQPGGDLVSSVLGDLTYDQVWDDRATLFPSATPIDFFGRAYEKLTPLLANANWLKLADFERVVPSFSGDTATLTYYSGNDLLARAIFRYVHELDWDFKIEAYINDDDGSELLDDDDQSLFIE